MDRVYAVSLVLLGLAVGVVIGLEADTGRETGTSVGLTESDSLELYFSEKNTSTYGSNVGFQIPESDRAIACRVSMKDKVQISRLSFKYVNTTTCREVSTSLEQLWGDESFEDVAVYERMVERYNQSQQSGQ
jgi:hypothetical protein